MGRLTKSHNEAQKREHKVFAWHSEGPFRVRCHDDGVTAVSSDGLTVELSANTVIQQPDREVLRSGIEVRTDGELVGHLTQVDRGFTRNSRALNLVGIEPGRFPEGARFRLRGIWAVSLDDNSGRLVRSWAPVGLLAPEWVKSAPSVTPEMMTILAAVRIGLLEVLRQSVLWKPEDKSREQ